MKTKISMWFAAAAAVGFTFGIASCGQVDPMPTSCSSDSQCSGSQACHPVLRQCVPGCTGAVDCPDSAKTCATFAGAPAGGDGGVRGFCQCSTDALCERASSGQVCQPATKICGAKCTATSGCPSGSTCDTASGKCSAGSTMMDAGMMTGTCTPGSCSSGQICNPTTQTCGMGATCSTANAQPDTCVYGLFCSGAACAEAPFNAASCMNFANVATAKAWNPATIATKGPVTTAFAPRGTNDDMACAAAAPNAFTYTVDLYAAPNTTFPSMIEMVPANTFNYVRTDGTLLDLKGGSVRPTSGYANGLTNGNKNLKLIWTACGESTLMSLRAGFYAQNGNANCANAMR